MNNDFIEFFKNHSNLETQIEISKITNLSKTQINRFVLGKTWKQYQSNI